MAEVCCFIDENGNRIYVEEIYSHIGLANVMLEQNEELKKEFEKSGKRDPVDFLIKDKGYMKVSDSGMGYKKLIFSSENISVKQKRALQRFRAVGYACEDLTMLYKSKEEQNR